MRTNCIYYNSRDGKCGSGAYANSKCRLTLKNPKACKSRTLTAEKASIYPDDCYSKPFTEVFGCIIESFFMREERKLCEGKGGAEFVDSRYKMGHFRFIPRGVHCATRMVLNARNYLEIQHPSRRHFTFLDCGAGVGNIMLLAKFAGLDAYGIEYDKRTLNRGHKVLKQFRFPDPKKKLFQGDLLEYDSFHKYDILYGYRPLSDIEKETQFEKKLMLGMKKGAIMVGLVAPPPSQRVGRERLYFKRIEINNSHSLFIKV